MYYFLQIRYDFTFLLSFIPKKWSGLAEHVGGLDKEEEE